MHSFLSIQVPRTPAQDRLGSSTSENLQNSQAERGGARVSLPLDHPQALSIVSLAAPLSAGRRGKRVHGSSRAHYSTQVSDRCDSGQNKTQIFQKESKNIFLLTISVLPLCSQSAQPFQPLATRAEAWQAIPGVSKWVIHSNSLEDHCKFLQPLFPHPRKGRRPATYSRSQSQAVLTSHKTLLLSHLDCLGLRVNFAKSILSPSQRVLFLQLSTQCR